MATFSELKQAGMKTFGEVGAWAFDEWRTLNETFFDGKIIVGPIVWGVTPNNRSIGYYSWKKNLIYLHKTLVRPHYPSNLAKWNISNLNKKLASDVLLHEMIHQMIHQTGGWEGNTTHNNERFIGEVNRIAKFLGLHVVAKVIKQKVIADKKTMCVEPGCLTHKELSEFPYSSRPDNYYYD